MNLLPLPTVADGHRNSSLLGAFALVLALAFGMGATAAPAFAVGQHLVSDDGSQSLLANVDPPLDIAIPVGATGHAQRHARTQTPPGCDVQHAVSTCPAQFLARAPPL